MSIFRVVALVAVPTLLLSATLFAQEKKIKRSDLPPRLRKQSWLKVREQRSAAFRRRPKMDQSVMKLS